MNRQSKPLLSKSSSTRRGPGTPGWHRTIIIVLGLFVCLMFWANLQLIKAPASHSRSSSSLRVLPQFTFPKYPVVSGAGKRLENPSPEIEAWNTWADEPMIGSYRFDDKIRIHNPQIDLQSYYHDIRPDFSQFISASASQQPLKLTSTKFPDPDGVTLTRKGNKFAASGVKHNQDRAIMITFGETDFWIGLFDGHGYHGHITSQYCSLSFSEQLIQQHSQMQSNEDVSPADIVKTIFNTIQISMPVIPEAGTTGISMWKRDNHLCISNVGDSKAFVVSFDRKNPTSSVQIIYETKPHKPDLPQERARIESMGGTVLDAPMPGESARLLIPNLQDPDLSMALAMSRSLGDQDGTKYGLSSEPTTDVIDLQSLDKSHDYFAVAASDGLLDHVRVEKVAIDFAVALVSNNNLLLTAEKLIYESSHGWAMLPIGGYRDDISVSMHRIRL